MNINLRIIKNKQIDDVPSLTNDLNDNLHISTKNETLTMQEVDTNFISIVKYLKIIAKLLREHSNILESLTPERIQDFSNVLDRVERLTFSSENLKQHQIEQDNNFNTYKNDIQNKLNRKIENIKTLNGINILGVGNTQINISRSQFTEHLNDIAISEIGSIIICNSRVAIIFNNTYAGSNLWNESYETFQGTWKCIGKISDKVGMFKRIN